MGGLLRKHQSGWCFVVCMCVCLSDCMFGCLGVWVIVCLCVVCSSVHDRYHVIPHYETITIPSLHHHIITTQQHTTNYKTHNNNIKSQQNSLRRPQIRNYGKVQSNAGDQGEIGAEKGHADEVWYQKNTCVNAFESYRSFWNTLTHTYTHTHSKGKLHPARPNRLSPESYEHNTQIINHEQITHPQS
jgi:hypothetical protein